METPTKRKRHENMQDFSQLFEQNSTRVTSSPSDIGSHLTGVIDPLLTDANAYQYATELPESDPPPQIDDSFSMFDDSQLVDMIQTAIREEMPAQDTLVDPLVPPPSEDNAEDFIRNCLNTPVVVPDELVVEKKSTSGKRKAGVDASTPRRATKKRVPSAQSIPTRHPPTSSPVMLPPPKRARVDHEELLANFNAQQDRRSYRVVGVGSLSAHFADPQAQANFKWLNRKLDDPEPPPSQLFRQTGYDFPVPVLSGMLAVKNNQPTMKEMNNSFGGPITANHQQQFDLPVMQNHGQFSMQQPHTPTMQTLATPGTPRSGPGLRFTPTQNPSTPTPESRRASSQPRKSSTNTDSAPVHGSNPTPTRNGGSTDPLNPAQVEDTTAATLHALGAPIIDFEAPSQVDSNPQAALDMDFSSADFDIDFSNVALDFDFDFDNVAWN